MLLSFACVIKLGGFSVSKLLQNTYMRSLLLGKQNVSFHERQKNILLWGKKSFLLPYCIVMSVFDGVSYCFIFCILSAHYKFEPFLFRCLTNKKLLFVYCLLYSPAVSTAMRCFALRRC